MAMMAFAGFVYFLSDRISLNALVKSALPLTLCGFLLIPSEGFLGTVVSSYMISAGYSFMTLLIALMLYDISKRFGIMVLLLFCLKNAMQIFVVWGREEARTTLRDHLSSKHKLSPREDEILRLYAQGMNGPQMPVNSRMLYRLSYSGICFSLDCLYIIPKDVVLCKYFF